MCGPGGGDGSGPGSAEDGSTGVPGAESAHTGPDPGPNATPDGSIPFLGQWAPMAPPVMPEAQALSFGAPTRLQSRPGLDLYSAAGAGTGPTVASPVSSLFKTIY